MKSRESITEILGEGVRRIVDGLPEAQQDKLEEIRLRVGGPLAVKKAGEGWFVASGGASSRLTRDAAQAYTARPSDLSETLALVSGYSIYAFEEEIKNGFISIRGGHRVGLCGKAVVENGEIKTLKNISSLNIRICHEIKGAADSVMSRVVQSGSVRHTLIISPPGKGKTTLLRDIVRQLSTGVKSLGFDGADVAVVDERSEIAGMFMGIPQNDVGARTDVLESCPKAKGMHLVLRSMSPSVVAADEIGRKDDVDAIGEILNAGVKLICTVHGDGLADVVKKPYLSELIEKRMFETFIVLSGRGNAGDICAVYDKNLNKLQGS